MAGRAPLWRRAFDAVEKPLGDTLSSGARSGAFAEVLAVGLRYAAGTDRPKVGLTPKDVVWKRDKAELWRYRSEAVQYAPPVVVVHSLVSRSYVLDLHPRNSAVRFWLEAGLDVMLLDWGVADAVEAENTLETYADHYLPEAVDAAREAAGTDDVTLLGYCFGGVLSLLSVARNPEMPVRNLAV